MTAQGIKTISDRVTSGNYFLLTYHNPYTVPALRILNDEGFSFHLIQRLGKLAAKALLEPTKGNYEGTNEASFMLSFAVLTTAQKLELVDIITEFTNDLGQDSFIYHDADQTSVMIKSSTGKVIATSQGVEFTDSTTNCTAIGPVKFFLPLKFK